MTYLPTIGLEIHLQLSTASKMFCGCSNKGEFEPPNTTICPICMGHPGTLPTINKEAVRSVIKAGLALDCLINKWVRFDRKNYFYPDLPKGYQISQYDHPICEHGSFQPEDNKKIRIRRIHLEEDTAKLFHDAKGSDTLVDFNRSGSPLMELVTEPDCSDAITARQCCQELQSLFRALKISDADMEKGHMRCEVNISLRPSPDAPLGTKVEIKNINSFRAMEKAIQYEIQRQEALLLKGEPVKQETRGWDDRKEATVSQRSKEEAHDYRYFPEPDLPPLEFSAEFINEIRAEIPELPAAKRARFQKEYCLSAEFAKILTKDDERASFYERTLSELQAWFHDLEPTVQHTETWEEILPDLSRLAAGWITTELFKLMNAKNISFTQIKITPKNFAEFLLLIHEKKINSSAAQSVLFEMFEHGSDPHAVMEKNQVSQIHDVALLQMYVDQVLESYPEQVAQYKQGKTNVIQFLLGKLMAISGGKANPQTARTILEQSLKH